MSNDLIPGQQLCVINIMFTVTNDDDAIAYKKKITEVLSPLPEARVEFRLSTTPNAQHKPPRNP